MDACQILIDSAGRPVDSAHQVLHDVSVDVLNHMPDQTHSSIAWLVWHSGRQMDAQLARLSGAGQVWTHDGWFVRFGLDRPEMDMGFGDQPADVAKVRVDDVSLLSGYLEAVVASLVAYLQTLSESDLDDVIGHFGASPVSRGARIVSMIDDAVAHVSQAAYLRGLVEGWKIGY